MAVHELQLAPEQLGAYISFLSCFPGACEILYGPGTYIEPKPERGGARMPGAVKVVEGQIHLKEHPVFSKETAAAVDDVPASGVAAKPEPVAKAVK